MITVVNRNHYSGPGIPITRGTIFGNPFVVGKDGSREQVIAKHKQFLWDCLWNGSDLGKAIFDLARRHLAGEHLILICACKPLGCHGDTIKLAILWLCAYVIGQNQQNQQRRPMQGA